MAYKFLEACFSREYYSHVSRKASNGAIVDILFPVPICRYFAEGKPGLDVLCRVKKMCVSPCTKSFFFRLHTGTLPVKTWLVELGMFVPWSSNCHWCGVPGTVDHCFIVCKDAIFLWEVFQRAVRKSVHMNSHSLRFLPVPFEEVVPLDMFILLGLHSMWTCRMMYRNEGKPICSSSNFKDELMRVRSIYQHQQLEPD